MNPLVSVVIPTYNRAQYIAETIESVLAQTYANLEIIVIDDGSTDNTEEVVARFAPKVRYVRQKNAERAAARNHGWRLAAGEFVSFLDSDDLWLPDKIEEELKTFEANPSAGLVYSDVIIIDAEGKQMKTANRKTYSGKVTERLLKDNFIFAAAHLIRTETVRKTGGFVEDRELSGSEDWEMWVRLSAVADFVHLPKVTAKYRTHAANTMSDAGAMSRSMHCAFRILSEADYLSGRQKKILDQTKSYIFLIEAINYCSAGENSKVFSSLKSAFGSNPQVIFDPRFGYTIFRSVKNNLTGKS